MATSGSITQILMRLKTGEDAALTQLHRRYWPTLVQLARNRLRAVPLRAADEEDVAQEVFVGFYNSFKAGRIPRLDNRHHLLALLTTITACTAANQVAREMTQRRGAGNVATESPWVALAADTAHSPLEQAVLHDLYERYVGSLPDHVRGVAERFLAGCTAKEIAGQMECAQRTVERKIALLKQIWRDRAAEEVERPVRSPDLQA